MQAFAFGPIYCETLSAVPGQLPVEPFNTVSNGVIVLFGLAGLYRVARHAPRTYDLYLLGLLLVATGIGSGIWHGLRDGDALFWEVRSGLFFLFAFVFCWGRRLWSYGAIPVLLLFVLGFSYSQEYFGFTQRWVAIAPLVIVTGTIMIAQTAMRSKASALFGAAALGLALVALTFRTIDRDVCDYVPIGTHFLWHSLLSAAGYVGILTLIGLPAAKSFRWGVAKTPVQVSAD